MREWFERRLGTLLIVGGAMFLLAWPLLIMGLASGSTDLAWAGGVTGRNAGLTAVGMVLLIGGISVFAIAAFTGLAFGVTEKRGARKSASNVRILARYALNSRNEPALVDMDSDDADPSIRFYVRVKLPGGSPLEFQCPRNVFLQCGEGMVGEAAYQGRWLGRFVPYIGNQP